MGSNFINLTDNAEWGSPFADTFKIPTPPPKRVPKTVSPVAAQGIPQQYVDALESAKALKRISAPEQFYDAVGPAQARPAVQAPLPSLFPDWNQAKDAPVQQLGTLDTLKNAYNEKAGKVQTLLNNPLFGNVSLPGTHDNPTALTTFRDSYSRQLGVVYGVLLFVAFGLACAGVSKTAFSQSDITAGGVFYLLYGVSLFFIGSHTVVNKIAGLFFVILGLVVVATPTLTAAQMNSIHGFGLAGIVFNLVLIAFDTM